MVLAQSLKPVRGWSNMVPLLSKVMVSMLPLPLASNLTGQVEKRHELHHHL